MNQAPTNSRSNARDGSPDAPSNNQAIQTIRRFYDAFAQLDAAGMALCYADSVVFRDEAFSLKGKRETMAMWDMLLSATRAHGLDAWALTCSGITAQGQEGKAHWEARYRFTRTRRLVHNRIEAHFVFDEQGLICQHRDHFNFWAWSRQALGTPGWLLGWTPWLRRQVAEQARAQLDRHLKSLAGTQTAPRLPPHRSAP